MSFRNAHSIESAGASGGQSRGTGGKRREIAQTDGLHLRAAGGPDPLAVVDAPRVGAHRLLPVSLSVSVVRADEPVPVRLDQRRDASRVMAAEPVAPDAGRAVGSLLTR